MTIRFKKWGRRNKYWVAPPAERTYQGILFHSKREMEVFKDLQLREKIGEITELKRQVSFPLQFEDGRAVLTPKGKVMEYLADFTYKERGVYHVKDVKGFDTPESYIKRQLVGIIHGITVEVVQ